MRSLDQVGAKEAKFIARFKISALFFFTFFNLYFRNNILKRALYCTSAELAKWGTVSISKVRVAQSPCVSNRRVTLN